tara:strand:- start:640 stop:1254 length:615 start_codon:yes stop_codon:yes gene_type:complete
MATSLEEFQAQRLNANRAIPGESLTNDPENPAPFEKAPTFTSVHAATQYLWESFIEPDEYMNLMTAVSEGVPLMQITQAVLFTEFTNGSWNPDLMLMLIEPTTYMLMALAERAELPMVIYEGELNDENDEEELLGTQVAEDRIREIMKRGKTGDIPEFTLTAEMQATLESLPPVELPPQQEEEETAPEQEQPQSLMARPETAGV